MLSKFIRQIILLAAASACGLVQLQASCGSASCPIETLNSESRNKGWFRLGYEFEYIDQDQPRIKTREARVGEIHGHHDEVYTVNRIHRVTASHGFTDRLSADVVLPFISRSHQHVHHHHGTDITDTWSFDGLGDLAVTGRYSLLKPASWPELSLIAGVEFPTGKDEVTNGNGDHAEPSITPGSKSYDVSSGLGLHKAFHAKTLSGLTATLPVFLTSTYRWNGKGEEDYRIGDVWTTNAGLSYPVFSRLSALAQVNCLVKARDGKGKTYEEVQKTGGEFVYATPGLQYRIAGGLYALALVQIPVHQRVNQIQLTSDYNYMFNLFYQFKKAE